MQKKQGFPYVFKNNFSQVLVENWGEMVNDMFFRAVLVSFVFSRPVTGLEPRLRSISRRAWIGTVGTLPAASALAAEPRLFQRTRAKVISTPPV